MSNAAFANLPTVDRTARKWNSHVYIWDTDESKLYVGDGATLGGKPLTGQGVAQQAAVSDVDASSLPADGTIAGLTISDPPTQAEVQALRAECEKLRDALAANNTTTNAILARLRSGGVIAT